MTRSFTFAVGILGALVAASSCGNKIIFDESTGGQTGTGTHSGSTGSGGQGSTSSGSSSSGTAGSGTSSSGGCAATDPNGDMDHDGWTPAQGDCNDCDPGINPGAIDVAADPQMLDRDCNGKFDPPAPCDGSLALDDVSAADAARAIELCQVTTAAPATPQEKTWGVISSAYVRADGTPFASPGLQVGLESAFGPSVQPRGGASMLVLSTGHARTASQVGACGTSNCTASATGTAPPGFPQATPGCPLPTTIADDVGIELKIRVPTNATGFSYALKLYSMEFPYWICDVYGDQFVALMTPPPMGAIHGNISFDAATIPLSANAAFFDVCDPAQSGMFAADCKTMGTSMCPTPASPYCPAGTAQLQGTGFDTWDSGFGGAGATPWLATQAPVVGGQEISLRFSIWDGGDQNFDSTILVDDFQWTVSASPVIVQTTRLP